MTGGSIQTPALTRAFCSTSSSKLVFQPETELEAAFIVRQLQNMGFNYYKPEYAAQLQRAVNGCLYLDTDRTIMLSDNKDTAGTACSVDGFDQFFIPAGIEPADARLAPDDCRQKTLVFYPRTVSEARGVLSALLGTGVTIEGGNPSTGMLAVRTVLQGILVQEGRISFGPTPEDIIGAQICTAADLGVNATVSLSPEQATIMAAFNEMAARMEQMAARIAAIEKEVVPQKMDKPPRLKGGTP